VPYPSAKDTKIELKKSYLDDCIKAKTGLLSGSDWYFHQAIRAVNQAVGRVIRHKDDFGAILLFDHRYFLEP
jgi:Rad3-related DNA helicase